MTAPRTALFQRKGAPAPSDTAGPPTGPDDASQDAMTVTCPQCGCEFDPTQTDQGSPPPMGGDAGSDGGDLGAKISAMMGGGGAPGA